MKGSGLQEQVTYSQGSDRGDRLRPHYLHTRYWHLTLLAEEMRRIARRLPGGATLIDYGCGNKPYEALFAETFGQYVGADLPGNPSADVTLEEGGTLPLEDESADAVLSSQVLEHVTDPALYLSEACRVLRPGGSLILSTHGFWKYHPDPTDYWRWTADGLRLTVEQAGFQVGDIRSVMNMASVAVQLWQDATINRCPRLLRTVYAGVMQRIIGLIERWRGDQFSANASVYVVLARKP